MKRFAVGVGWFVVFWLCGLFELSVVAAISIHGAHQGRQASRVISDAYVDRYGMTIFLIAIAVAIAGTATGFLPGTRKKPRPVKPDS